MKNYPQEFLDVMNSNIRPKCEPRITIRGTDINGEEQTIVWNAKDIQSLKFKRTIDPVGRNLPTMELQWTELYYGKFSKDNMPIKYENIIKYMEVSLEWEQSLAFFSSWKDIKDKFTWKSLKELTWNRLKNNIPTYTVKMPLLFLSATPEASGQTITWTAKDALSFLTENQIKSFLVNTGATTEIPFYNPIVHLLVNARAAFSGSKELWDYYTRTIDYFAAGVPFATTYQLNHGIIIDDATNSAIMNYLSPQNQYLDFDDDKIITKEFWGFAGQSVTEVPLKLQYGNPTIENVAPMSQYSYKRYSANISTSTEDVNPASTAVVGADEYGPWYRSEYLFPKYAVAVSDYASDDINKAIRFVNSSSAQAVQVHPVEYSATDESIVSQKYGSTTSTTAQIGEVYTEDNKLNVYPKDEIYNRLLALSTWFQSGLHTIKATTPALFHWNIDEWAMIETPLWDSSTNEPLTAMAQLLETEITYNGAVKQNIIARETAVVHPAGI